MKSTTIICLLAVCGSAHAGPRCFVPNHGEGTVSVFDQAYINDPSGRPVEQDAVPGTGPFDRIHVGSGSTSAPTKVAVSPDSQWAFSSNSGDNTVSWFSAGLRYDASSAGFFYKMYAQSIPVGTNPTDIVVAAGPGNPGYNVWVANTGSNNLSVINPLVKGTYTLRTPNVAVLGAGGLSAISDRAMNYPSEGTACRSSFGRVEGVALSLARSATSRRLPGG